MERADGETLTQMVGCNFKSFYQIYMDYKIDSLKNKGQKVKRFESFPLPMVMYLS